MNYKAIKYLFLLWLKWFIVWIMINTLFAVFVGAYIAIFMGNILIWGEDPINNSILGYIMIPVFIITSAGSFVWVLYRRGYTEKAKKTPVT
jgi:hypothetical protein